ncbi:MAG: hypothetical protein QG632_732 [Candidatus Dependentiae bacterium]|nr:hypothetical protein [Candidatus Dependentiae bacterium]
MKRIMMLVLSLAVVSGVQAATAAATPTAATPAATERGYWDRTQDYYMANDVDADAVKTDKHAKLKTRARRAGGSLLSAGGLGLAATEIAMNRNFLLEFLSKYIKNEGAQKFMNHRATKVITSLLEAIALDEIAGAVNGNGGRRGLVSGGVRDGYAWGKKKLGKKSDTAPAAVAA